MTAQGDRQASVRAATGTALTYEGDWHALFDQSGGIAAGPFDGRLLAWINQQLSTTYTELNGAMQAYATSQGAFNWSSMGAFSVVFWTPQALVTAGQIVGWWDAGSGITQSGGLVSAWADRVAGYIVTQATGSLKPAYSLTALNSVAPGLLPDGADDTVALTGVPAPFPTAAAAGWIFTLSDQQVAPGDTTTRSAGAYGSTNIGRNMNRTVVGGVNRFRVLADATNLNDTHVDMTGISAQFGIWDGTNETGRINGQDFGASTPVVPTTATSRVRICSNANGAATQFWQGAIGQFIVGTGAIPALADQQRLEAWALWSCGEQTLLPVDHPYYNRRP